MASGRTSGGGRLRWMPLAVVPLALLLAGCGEKQSTLAPASHQSRDIASLFWWMLGGAWIGMAAVVGLLLLAWRRRRTPGLVADPNGDRTGWLVVLGAGIALPVAVVATLFVISDIFVIRTTEAPARNATRLTVLVVGHEWWWEVRYPGTAAVTANEIHIPVRTPVRLEVRTADVIHSFWVPALNRKIDTIPGQTNAIELYADAPGRYRGQCAEFCGLQHAHMSMWVVADRPAAFRRWLARESQPARAPASALAQWGERVFVGGACSACHTIAGTPARGDVGPDLTHLQSRSSLGALTAANTPQELSSWIAGSQHDKPGNQMPDIQLPSPQLQALLAYLEGLR